MQLDANSRESMHANAIDVPAESKHDSMAPLRSMWYRVHIFSRLFFFHNKKYAWNSGRVFLVFGSYASARSLLPSTCFGAKAEHGNTGNMGSACALLRYLTPKRDSSFTSTHETCLLLILRHSRAPRVASSLTMHETTPWTIGNTAVAPVGRLLSIWEGYCYR